MVKNQRSNRKKTKKQVSSKGHAHVMSTFNNTIVTISTLQNHCVVQKSAGHCGYKGARKSTPYAAETVGNQAGAVAKEQGVKSVKVYVKGPGSGRESAVRALSHHLEITEIIEATKIPHNGCRPKKSRRV